MILQLGSRIAGTVDPRLLATMAWNFGFKGARSVLLFKQRLKKGIVFPPFLYLSIINSCNLRCQGCWVDVESPRNMIELDELNTLSTTPAGTGIASSASSAENPSCTPACLIFYPSILTVISRSSPMGR